MYDVGSGWTGSLLSRWSMQKYDFFEANVHDSFEETVLRVPRVLVQESMCNPRMTTRLAMVLLDTSEVQVPGV